MIQLKDANPDVGKFMSTFEDKKRKNKHSAACMTALFSLLVFTVVVCFVQFSTLRPFSSVKDNVSLLFSTRYAFSLILDAIVVYTATFFLVRVFSVDYEANINLSKAGNAVAFAIVTLMNVAISLILSITVNDARWTSNRMLAFQWLISTLASSVLIGYLSDFKLKVHEPLIRTVEEFRAQLYICLVNTAMALVCAWPTTFVLGLLSSYLRSSLLHLFAFWNLVDLFVIIFAQQFMSKQIVFTVNYYMGFSTCCITEGFPENPTTLVKHGGILAALYSKDHQSQLQALHRLFLMCTTNTSTRKPIFEVSQPGKHPRNWEYTRDICKYYINIVLSKLQSSTHSRSIRLTKNVPTKANSSVQSLSPTSPDLKEKQSFFVPPSITHRRNGEMMQGVTDDLNVNVLSHNTFGYVPLPPIVNDFVQRIKSRLFEPPQLISPFELECAIFAAKSVAALLSNALLEDSYGVTQKDNKVMISLLAQLTIAIDGFARSYEPIRMRREKNIMELDTVVAHSLVEIGDAFGEYVYKVNLHPNDIEVIETLCGDLHRTNETHQDQSGILT
ncbi:nucleoporin protein ndc1-Nup domain-containing protein [Ditylenchus destructor]|uniref:Nucleoporin protein ndc1-Nup domain-containing protein n=1 Tax=Ditylenchus destructor TaxID=166010 RepID=A0AAD4N2D9_9BILA|nr:nucleoporin protein ndc1-Nup domain-containing protein [Ditylenchus destructor]